MGFYLRKSIKAGPIRFNLSKSGIGTSIGVKGMRVGVKSNGKNYMHAGRYGFYYRKDLSSSGEVDNNTNTNFNKDETVFFENRSDIQSSHKPELLKNKFLMYFLLVPMGFVPIIGMIYWWIVALRNLFKTKVRFYYYESAPVYVRDRRYKNGQRLNGYQKVKRYTNALSSIKTQERILFIFKGIVALSLAVSFSYYNYEIFIKSKKSEKNAISIPIKKAIVKSKAGLNLRESNSINSNILITIPYNTEVNILENYDQESEWINISYEGSSGWVAKKYLEIN